MTSITLQAAARPAGNDSKLPRGARWAVALALPLFLALERLTTGRAARRMPAPAASNPTADEAAAAARLRREREAARVRRYAMELAVADPRTAADLFAACDRHERGD